MLEEGFLVMIYGMGLVFGALVVLMIATEILEKIFRDKEVLDEEVALISGVLSLYDDVKSISIRRV
ncbi:MAG: OadG family protein [Candidatus Methanofastidiosia archaeon]